MNLRLTAFVEEFKGAGFLGYVDNIKGIVVHGDTPEEAFREILLSLKVKMAYDWNVDVASVKEMTFNSEAEMEKAILKFQEEWGRGKKDVDVNLSMAV